ncbi:MAG: hypothetical protein HPY85_14485 [Anaerolineae bacterium]|nr:hypothetical protein [Anaerolineae bacterium]
MSNSEQFFHKTHTPDKRKGLVVVGSSLLVAAGGTVSGLIFMLRTSGSWFVLWLFVFLFCLSALPFLGFSLHGLLSACYQVRREGIRLRWGLREVFLPMEQVQWVRSAESVSLELHLPPGHWSGIIRGITHTRELGQIEFLASRLDTMLLVATAEQVFAISPQDPAGFTRAVQYAMESGNLSPAVGVSIQPASFLLQVWEDRLGRGLIAGGIAFNLALLVITTLLIPRQSEIQLGFSPGGLPQEPIPAISLRLLSLLSVVLGGLDFLLGILFYRKTEYRVLSYILWGAAGILPFLFTLAIALSVR